MAGEVMELRAELASIMSVASAARHRTVRIDRDELMSCLRAFDVTLAALSERDEQIAALKAENTRLSTRPFTPRRLLANLSKENADG